MKFLADNSILSSLAKIGRLDLLKELGSVSTTSGVVHEALNSHIGSIETAVENAAGKWLKMEEPVDKVEVHRYKTRHPVLSYVDSELILTAREYHYALLTDDRDLGRYAEKDCGITVFDLPTLLLALKGRAFPREEIAGIISDLEKKDRYVFTEEVKKVLLEAP
jgi:predicted nucleic acid-binding protein